MNNVLTLSTYDATHIAAGDLVAEEVIDLLRNNQIPATDWSSLFQSGGAICDRITSDGILRPAFSTFERVAIGIWRYCGCCLRGERTERGEVPDYEKTKK